MTPPRNRVSASTRCYHDRVRPPLLRRAIPCVVLLAAACSRGPAPRQFQLTGQVVTVASDATQLVVRHDEIKGFMPAMTMPFRLKEASLGRDRRPGDLIRATLMVTDEESWLSAVEKTGWAPIPDNGAEARPAVEVLKPGESVPDETLIDQDARAFRLSSLRGSAVLLTYIYTRCPLPEFCPRMDAYFASVQKTLADGRLAGPVRLLSVSFDPTFDTPAVLKEHARAVGADPRVWTFATAPADRVEAWGARLGLSVIHDAQDPSVLTHNLRTAVIDAQGRLVTVLDGNRWTVDDAVAALGSAGR
jgi:protein SCO1